MKNGYYGSNSEWNVGATEEPEVQKKAYFGLITAAVAQCSWNRAKKLIEEDPYDLELANIQGKECMSVLHIMCMNTPPYNDDEYEYESTRMLEVAKAILEKSKSRTDKIYQPDLFGKLPLHLCIHGRYKHGGYQGPCLPLLEIVVHHLKKVGLLQQQVCQKELYNGGITPLHYMAQGYIHDLSLCQQLICKDDISIEEQQQLLVVQDSQLDTPLHYSAGALQSHSDMTLFIFVVTHGPQANFMYNDAGYLPMDYMIRSFVRMDLEDPIYTTTTTADGFYYYYDYQKSCISLTQQAEKSIMQQLWPQLEIMVQAAAKYKLMVLDTVNIHDDDDDDWTLVHLAAICHSFPLIILICALKEHPNAIQQIKNGYLPIHLALLSYSLPLQNRINTTNSNNNRRTNHHTTNANAVELARWNMPGTNDKMTRSNYTMVEYLLQQYPNSVHIWTKEKQLAIHLACAYGASWYDIHLLLKASPKSISYQDGLTKLFPFMLAAVHDNNTLDVIFNLLLFDPEMVRYQTNSNRQTV